jgi:transcription factor E2F4/5
VRCALDIYVSRVAVSNVSNVVVVPLVSLSPPPSDKDYCFNLDESEGVCDLFDVTLI